METNVLGEVDNPGVFKLSYGSCRTLWSAK